MGAGVSVPVGGWDERIVPVLDHVRCESFRERMCHCVEVSQHDVAVPPNHEADRVRVDMCHEEGHGAAGLHR